MAKKFLDDQEILQALKGGPATEEFGLAAVYRQNKEAICALVRKKGASEAEAKDVFQEAVIAFYENVRAGKFKQESNIATYLHAIARYLWINRLRRQKTEDRILDQQEIPSEQAPALDNWLAQEQQEQIQALFDQLGSHCREVLIYTIYYDYSMKEIVEKLHYENEQVVRNRKYKCLKKLKELLRQRPDLIHLLKPGS